LPPAPLIDAAALLTDEQQIHAPHATRVDRRSDAVDLRRWTDRAQLAEEVETPADLVDPAAAVGAGQHGAARGEGLPAALDLRLLQAAAGRRGRLLVHRQLQVEVRRDGLEERGGRGGHFRSAG